VCLHNERAVGCEVNILSETTLDHAVAKLKRGDRSAFDVVYDQTKTKVFYTILAIVHDYSLSEDIMQDTYIKMLESLPSYRRRGKFEGWLLTIARNLALNTLRNRKRSTHVDPQENLDWFGSTESVAESHAELAEWLKELNDGEKEIVIRHAVLDETHKSIAKTMGKPLGTVTWTYQNALKKIRSKAGESRE